MKYINELHENENIKAVFLVRQRSSAVTKNGKAYDNVILQDKTGNIDAKIWDPNSAGIDEFEALDYVEITGLVKEFNSALQISINRARKVHEGEYDPADYLPVSRFDIDTMFSELLSYIDSIKNPYLKKLCEAFFRDDPDFIARFKKSSAAKSVHHGFIGGLLEHTLSVTKLCEYYTRAYPDLKKDLLISVAILHDIGKIKELSEFPMNDYTDDGQLLGHIVMGSEMIVEKIKGIEGFPDRLASEVRHCILAHHGEYEFGSPKKPALMEAMALNFADNTDARMETFAEQLRASNSGGWLGFNRLLDSNIRKTGEV